MIPVLFGEVLFDTYPDGNRVLGGAPFNVAWHLQAFGAGPLFVSRVGEDPNGDEVSSRMRSRGMRMDGLQRDPVHPTGEVTIRYHDGQPSFEILPNQAYDHIEAAALPSVEAGLLYHGSLAVRTARSADALQKLKAGGAPVFVDINLRAPWWNRDTALAMLADARWAKLNDEELAELAGPGEAVEASAEALRERLSLELLIVTLGAAGALAVTPDERFRVEPEPGVPVVDPVGAGDAFASIVLLGLIRQWPLRIAIERGQAFASRIVGQQGATVDDAAFYAPFREAWGVA